MAKFVGQTCRIQNGGQVVAFRRDNDGKSNFVTVDCDTLEVTQYDSKEAMNAATEDREWAEHVAARNASKPVTLVEQILDAPGVTDGPEFSSEEEDVQTTV